MLNKNEIYTANVVDYTAEGQGIAKVDGCAVFGFVDFFQKFIV